MKYFGYAVLGTGISVLLLPLVGVIGYRIEIWDYHIGIAMVVTGIFLSLAGLLGSIIGLISLLVERQADFISFFLIGVVLCAGWSSYTYVKYSKIPNLPLTNDISTDVSNPPEFLATAGARGVVSFLVYTDQKRELQQKGYPDLETLHVALNTEESFRLASEIINHFEWELISSDPEAGIIEATDTTFWFAFKDDIVIRIQSKPIDAGSLIDVRSASRQGKADFGVNAQRVLRFLTEFERAAQDLGG